MPLARLRPSWLTLPWQLALLGVLVCLALLACTRQQPIKLGFIGMLSGRFSDLGVAARNGAQLAVDQVNQAGGIHGRQVVLVAQDDMQDEKQARVAMRALLDERVVAIVGPVSSTMAMLEVPGANGAGVPMIGISVTTEALSRLDDQFFRVVSDARQFAQSMATTLRQRCKLSRVVVIADMANADYARDWTNEFVAAFVAQGGQVQQEVTYNSMLMRHYSELASTALRDKPDGVVMVGNSVDAAILGQQLRRLDAKVALAASESAGTPKLLSLGGRALEGMVVGQYYSMFDTSPTYLRFRDEYKARFDEEPSFPGTLGYDAASVALRALAEQKSGASLKSTLLRLRSFPGLQSEIHFDDYGDVIRPNYRVIIQDGHFAPLP